MSIYFFLHLAYSCSISLLLLSASSSPLSVVNNDKFEDGGGSGDDEFIRILFMQLDDFSVF